MSDDQDFWYYVMESNSMMFYVSGSDAVHIMSRETQV